MCPQHEWDQSGWSKPAVVVWVLFGLAGLVIGALLLLPSGGGREAYRRAVCVNNLKQIGLALNNYHAKYHCFPPAYIPDADGKPMHSWRVLLLPYLEEPAFEDLFRQYDFNEPWNGPNNRKLAERAIPIYRCPSDTSDGAQTSYLAVVGDETMWPGAKNLTLRKMNDGSSKTIAVVEVANSGIGWTEPRDLPFDQAVLGINSSPPRQSSACIHSEHSAGANLLFADGSVHFLTNKVPPETLRALLTANGGETVTIPDD